METTVVHTSGPSFHVRLPPEEVLERLKRVDVGRYGSVLGYTELPIGGEEVVLVRDSSVVALTCRSG